MASTDAKPVAQKNVAFRVTFPILDADGDLVTGAAGLDSEISKDGGTFADCTNEATEIATNSGMYFLDLTSTEMNADTVAIIVKTSTTGAKTTPIVMYPEEAGDIRVNATQLNGTGLTGRDIGASVLLSTGTGTGQLDFTSGVVKANLAQILGTALTETAGQIAAAFKKFFNVATPTGTVNSIPDAVAGATGGLFIAGTNAATTVTTALTTTFTGNVTGSVASVTGAVGSVTGNVGGNVTGSVGSVASGGITNASLAADTGLKPIRSNTAQSATGTTIVLDASASATDDFYNNCIIVITGGTGVGQARFISDYTGASKTAAVPAWVTNPDNTSTFSILPFGSIPGATAPTAAEVADAVWDEARTDHTTSGSFGQGAASVQGNVTGSVGSVTGAVGSVTGNVGGNVTGSVGSVTGLTASDVGAIKTKTDSLTFTVAGMVDSNVIDWKSATAPAMTGDAFARLGAPAGASVSADIAAVPAAVWAVGTRLLTAGTNIVLAKGTGVTGFNDLSAAQVNAEADTALADVGLTATVTGRIDAAMTTRAAQTTADAIKAKTDLIPGTQDGYTFAEYVKLSGAVIVGKVGGLPGSPVFRSMDNSANRVTATTDADGNRTAVTLTP